MEILLWLALQQAAYAKSMRTVHLSDGEMESVFVEPGYSTLIRFDNHPEPGLIGDQDGFKVEYMKNMVAIKPLVSRGQTNLFLFTKDGQFNFQLIAGRGRHDNIVYVQAGPSQSHGSAPKAATLVDDLLTRKLGKVAANNSAKLLLDSISTPISHSTLVLHASFEQHIIKDQEKVDDKWFSVYQGAKKIHIENIFLEMREHAGLRTTSGLILIRAQELKKSEPLRLELANPAHQEAKRTLSISFSADLGRH